MPRQHTRKWQKEDWRADAIAAMGEFIGTFVFLFVGLGAIQSARQASQAQGVAGSATSGGAGEAPAIVSLSDPAFLLMSSTGMGISLVFSASIFFRVSGAAFNPNVALTLLLLGAISPIRFVFYVVAEILGAIAASAVLLGLLPGTLNVNCAPSNGTGVAQALFIEMFLTFGLCMTVVMLAVERNKATPLAPLFIGFALFATQLMGINFTGASVNTARAFGSAVVTGDFVGSHWIYWLGPSLGAVLAAALHKMLRNVHYWELMENADATSEQEAEKTAQGASHPSQV